MHQLRPQFYYFALVNNTPKVTKFGIAYSSQQIKKINKNLAPRDELRSQIWYVWLVGFEPTTSRVVNRALYPLSYNHTQAQNTRVVSCLINLDFSMWKTKYFVLLFHKSCRTFWIYSRYFPF